MAKAKKKAAAGKKAAKAPVKAASPAKTKWIVAILALVLIGLGAEGYYMAKSQSSQSIELVHVGPIHPTSIPHPRSMKGDSEGNFLRLNGRADTWKLVKYDASFLPKAEFNPKGKDQVLVNAASVAADEQGNVYVAQSEGEVKILDKNLAFVSSFKTGQRDVTDLDVDGEGRIHLVSRAGNKVGIYGKDGALVTEYGTPESKGGGFANPSRIVIQPKSGRIVILETIATGTRVRMLNADLSPEKAFIIPPDKMAYSEYTGMGVTPGGLAVFNDNEKSVVFFNLAKGKFHGSARSTQDNQSIISPGSVGVNKWTGDIYVDFIPGVMKCSLPAN
jgi:hypothetical protein